MSATTEQLRSFLTDSGKITEREFEDAKTRSEKGGERLEDVLVSEGFVTRDEITMLKANISGIPFVNLEGRKIPPDVLKIIPENVARANNIVAFRKSDNGLEVAMLDPEDLRMIDFIKKTVGTRILPRLTTTESIKGLLRQYQEDLKTEFDEMVEEEGAIKIIKEEEGKKGDDLERVAREVSVIRVVDTLIKHAILEKASDIHIEPQEKEIVVRYRVDGILRDAMVLPSNIAPGLLARIKILSELKLDEHRLPQDGRFKIETEDYKYSIRLSILPVADGEKAVMRLLPESAEVLTLDQIGLAGEALVKVRESLRATTGMILVTGPTGSGKTTTLYSILDILNTPRVNISTVEDPIEYRIPRINQTQINSKIGLTFASGLRSLVRQDPDIIMVGEIRDSETAHLAVNAALTGHLVLSTLHTTDASGAASRMMDMGIEPFLISSTFSLVVAQRLIRRLYGDTEKYRLNDVEIDELSKHCDIDRVESVLREMGVVGTGRGIKDIDFNRPIKSKEAPEGYKGRIGVYEVLSITDPIRDLIILRSSSGKIAEQARKEGMITIFEDGLIKAAQGLTSIEEVLRVTID